jgi:hypothetical protein
MTRLRRFPGPGRQPVRPGCILVCCILRAGGRHCQSRPSPAPPRRRDPGGGWRRAAERRARKASRTRSPPLAPRPPARPGRPSVPPRDAAQPLAPTRRPPRGDRHIRGLPFGEALIRPRDTKASAPTPTAIGGSSNGRTPDSDSGCLGSNPSPPATHVALYQSLDDIAKRNDYAPPPAVRVRPLFRQPQRASRRPTRRRP